VCSHLDIVSKVSGFTYEQLPYAELVKTCVILYYKQDYSFYGEWT
jgi:hypothetical protein